MISRNLKYTLGLLGCTASCLINISYANQTSGHEQVDFTFTQDIGNATCAPAGLASLPVYYAFRVTNVGEETIEIEDYSIVIDEENDDFPDNTQLVTVIPDINDSIDPGCTQDMDLDPGESCWLYVVVDTSTVECPDFHNPIEEGEVERALVIEVDAGSQKELVYPVDFDITILGTAEEYAIFANKVIAGVDTKSDPSLLIGDVQVSQDVGCLDFGCETTGDLDDIWFHDGAELFIYFLDIYPSQFISNQNTPAYRDLISSFDTFLAAAGDYDSALSNPFECNGGNLIDGTNLGVGITEFNGGIYCLDDNGTDTYNILSNITFNGDEDTLFVLVMESQITNQSITSKTLNIQSGADFDFEQPVDSPVDPGNIYWVNADQINLCPGAEFVGNIITQGDFTALDMTTGAALPCPEIDTGFPITVPGTIVGRVLSALNGSTFIFNGNTISEPKPSEPDPEGQ